MSRYDWMEEKNINVHHQREEQAVSTAEQCKTRHESHGIWISIERNHQQTTRVLYRKTKVRFTQFQQSVLEAQLVSVA